MADDDSVVTLLELPGGVGMLVVKRGPNTGSRYVLEAEVTKAGRHPESDIFLDDITVSRRHAEFVKSGGFDLGAGRGVAERHLRQPGTHRRGHALQRGRSPDW